jgi:hypothetical protein
MFKSPTEFLLLVILIIGIVVVAMRFTQPVVIVSQPSTQQFPMMMDPLQQQHYVQQEKQPGADDRYAIAPRPQREWQTRYELPTRGALDRIPTRGPPESYQQMGLVTAADGKILPLYGRRVAPRSDFFNYYTRTDTYNPVPLPITFNKRDCQDNAGCKEVSSGDEVRISPTGDSGKVTLYGFDGPRY